MFDRNDRCFCESGKKFKLCCGQIQLSKLDRERVITFKPHEVVDAMKNSVIKECLYPTTENCRKISGAHSIQRERILRNICEDNHVLQMEVNTDENSSRMSMNKKGIKTRASIFFGFCNHHDQVFTEIEKVQNVTETNKQLFLFAYRALSQSYHTSKEMYKFVKMIKNKEPLIVFSKKFQMDVIKRWETRKSFERYKNQIDMLLMNGDYDALETVKLVVNKPSQVAAASCFTLLYDLDGRLLVSSDKQAKVMLTAFSENKQTILLISWLKSESHLFENFRNSILRLSEQQTINLINNIIPLYCENYFIGPRLWKVFSTEEKETLLRIGEANAVTVALRKNLLKKTNYSFFKQAISLLSSPVNEAGDK